MRDHEFKTQGRLTQGHDSQLWIQIYGWTVFICLFCFWVNWPFNEQRGQISLVAILKNYLQHSRQTPNCDYMPFNV